MPQNNEVYSSSYVKHHLNIQNIHLFYNKAIYWPLWLKIIVLNHFFLFLNYDITVHDDVH